jgi:hypothetical protein
LRRRSAPASITAGAIGLVAPDEALGRIWPYLGAVLLALIVMALFLWLSIGFLWGLAR